ncbi:beta-galactosidase [Pararcticibacter amylolyticus]|uniref:Beta-galactosidase n=1 Tax=Pararcticibacter amylolyticus TaxID=2173175 RepID=A0A2U2PJH4_9SPHI|nr:beta-galactosidase [Pararcticibacter amylolyticus]PWG81414.1 beta-galactosidase [Pararcticibacter amylolyticus]
MKQLATYLFFAIFMIHAVSAQPGDKHNFGVGNRTFLLDGKPFVIKAAEIHYPRIPKEYWEHRIKMSKALGMNTICLYVFWNYHEPEEGKYDFSGQKDIAAFCRLAQKQGMYVIVRPGPYVCAEWEMGGLPWWLLKKKDIRLRTQDPFYIASVRRFMKQVGAQLAGQQITRGGNIIMVQVENEYGAYGTDKAYVAEVRDIVKESGFTDVPLFQCDWNSNFQNNALDDLLWTINFGTGANIDDQFRKLKELRPNTPLMCSEFWSGWFDHWGAKHETRSAAELVKGMKDMLDKNISFSLYMTHGGTSFGHWAGANFPNFSPTCTSYDYDAPISESGRTTPKFFEVRNLLKNYLPEGEKLSEIPDSIPTISIPAFELKQAAPLFENLPQPQLSKDIKSMEAVGQGWGSILYRTTLRKSTAEQTLILTEAHDWTQVFVDGKRIGILSRMKGEGTIALPPVKEGAVLDILVEPMGRMNFGKGIYDWKGITEKVEIRSGEVIRELKNWKIYSFPVNYSFVKDKTYRERKVPVNTAAWYKGAFNLNQTGDTFIDMSSWSKGMVWINGYAIGRYWQIGPQQTLYVPGCWLKKGLNEIIVFDLASPEKAQISGLRQPILDVLKGNSAFTHRKYGQNLDLKDEKPFFQGTFRPGNGWQHIRFGKAEKVRYFCLESLSSFGDDNYASVAELEIVDENGKPLSRQHWKVLYADSEETEAANNVASNVFDLQESTYWHTNYTTTKAKQPHQIVIDIGEEKTVSGFSYLPRPEEGKTGMIKDFRVYVKLQPFKF